MAGATRALNNSSRNRALNNSSGNQGCSGKLSLDSSARGSSAGGCGTARLRQPKSTFPREVHFPANSARGSPRSVPGVSARRFNARWNGALKGRERPAGIPRGSPGTPGSPGNPRGSPPRSPRAGQISMGSAAAVRYSLALPLIPSKCDTMYHTVIQV